ncbi:hypothetical protein C8Q80DRAFT_1105655 [Daedaleopsis nitida]|nr:hypothetical protein C8Q80DRAFT_1105655 [Daedaleopsis nitida]
MTPKTSLAHLNYDVLLHIITFLARHDLSSFMKTSSHCYDLCLRQLFQGPIEITSDNILSLHSSLRVGTVPSRSSFLSHIIIACSLVTLPCFSGGCGPMLSIEQLVCEILRDACHLKALQLDWGAASSSSYLSSTPTWAFHLEELHVPFVSQALCDKLTALSAPLRRLVMKFGPMNHFPAANPIALLEPFHASLDALDLSVVHCEDAKVQYLHVQNLTLSDCYYGLTRRGGIDIGPIVRAFPNLVDFTLYAAKVQPALSHWELGRCCDHVDVIERCRRLNQQHWQLAAADSSIWASLARVTGGHVVDIYMLGLCQPVPQVEIEALSEGTLWMLPYVLSDTRPSSLGITLFARDHILDALPRLIPAGEGTSRLGSLSLVLRCDVPDINVEKLISNIIELLLPHCIEALSVELSRWDTDGPYLLSQPCLTAIDTALEGVFRKCNDIALCLSNEIPSLRVIELKIGRHETRFTR